jgi:hypothetical protein
LFSRCKIWGDIAMTANAVPFPGTHFDLEQGNFAMKTTNPNLLTRLATLALCLTSSSVWAAESRADVLLQAEFNRAATVDKLVSSWGAELTAAERDAFRVGLLSARVDRLLAASVAGSYEAALEAVLWQVGGSGRVELGSSVDASKRVSPAIGSAKAQVVSIERGTALSLSRADQSKTIGDANRDFSYTPVTPCRLHDSRAGQSSALGTLGGVMANQTVRTISAGGKCGLPASGIKSVFVTFHSYTFNPELLGVITFQKTGAAPTGLAATWTGGVWATGTIITDTLDNGSFDVFVGNPAVMSADMVIDVVGYFSAASGGGGITGIRVTNESSASPTILGGAAANTATAGVRGATISGGGALTGTDADFPGAGPNIVNDHYGYIGGGASNRVGNDNADPSDATFATIAGGRRNIAAGQYSFVGGGVDNSATGYISAVVGGDFNRAIDSFSFVGGGNQNLASGLRSAVGGGKSNTASGVASGVFAGENNFAAGLRAGVLSGEANNASGDNSVVVGGSGNNANGANSFAGGVKANASLPGCFVWADSTNEVVSCEAADQFVARARGGVKLITGATTAAILPSGSGAWNSLSDINTKTAIANVSPRNVLEALLKMPVLTWQYKAQPGNVRHMGPSAQAFRKAFGLGDSPLGISTVDADGVALAAIQGLNQKLVADSKSKDAKIATLERELAAIKKKLGL